MDSDSFPFFLRKEKVDVRDHVGLFVHENAKRSAQVAAVSVLRGQQRGEQMWALLLRAFVSLSSVER